MLVIGPKSHRSGKTGGVVVLMENVLSSLASRGVLVNVIDSNKRNYRFRFLGYLMIIYRFLTSVRKSDKVVLHGTAFDYLFIAPIIVLISRLFKKKVYLAKFAGNYDAIFSMYNPLSRGIMRWTLRHASGLFWETKYLVSYFKEINSSCFWLPNMRQAPPNPISHKVYKKRFIFLGHVNEEKGVPDLYKIAEALGGDYCFDLYGRLEKQEIIEEISSENISYKGEIDSSDVLRVLQSYDVLLFPSRRSAEGYPGVVIEAFSCGIPTIAYQLKGLKEMIESGSNGILVPLADVDSFHKAIESINSENYERFSKYALDSFKSYEERHVMDKYLGVINAN